jgi:hypothetical protein
MHKIETRHTRKPKSKTSKPFSIVPKYIKKLLEKCFFRGSKVGNSTSFNRKTHLLKRTKGSPNPFSIPSQGGMLAAEEPYQLFGISPI